MFRPRSGGADRYRGERGGLMSYGITPYVVPLAALQAAFGSRSEQLLAAVRAGRADAFREIEAALREETSSATQAPTEADAGPPSIEQALTEIVEGSVSRPDHAAAYGHALELCCAELGERQPSLQLSTTRTDLLDELDLLLARHQSPLRTARLLDGPIPVPVPRPAAFPGISMLEGAEVAAALSALGAIDATGVDPAVADALARIRGWLEACASERGRVLVCFFDREAAWRG
jgi:hypothetical protein